MMFLTLYILPKLSMIVWLFTTTSFFSFLKSFTRKKNIFLIENSETHKTVERKYDCWTKIMILKTSVYVDFTKYK